MHQNLAVILKAFAFKLLNNPEIRFMQVDTIIVGQGICGTFLSWNLKKAGQKVLVIDTSNPFSSTKLASGVINPVTGRRIVRTWEIEKLLPFALTNYSSLGNELGIDLIRQCNILDFHPTPQMELAFRERSLVETEYLREPENADHWKQYFNYPFGIGEINPCLLIDLNAMLAAWRKQLLLENALIEMKFTFQDFSVTKDQVQFQGITAKQIIFCEGTGDVENPYFHLLPFARNKGEVIIASIPDLSRKNIYKQGINLVPWKDDLWWIGSTYEWKFNDLATTDAFLQKTKLQLNHWLKLPYEILDHYASERPATIERRPFIGFHPIHQNIGLFNGMGTKGCSLAPYFAAQFAASILNNVPLDPLIDISRFKKILSS